MIATPHIESLVHALAPETNSRPLYVLLQSDAPEPSKLPTWANGFAGSALDLTFESWLRGRRRWQGRGACFFVADSAITHEAAQLAPDDHELSQTLIQQRLHVVALHELAHLCEGPLPFFYPSVTSSGLSDTICHEHVAWAGADDAPNEATPMQSHGWQWVRAFLHLVARYQDVTGQRLPLSLLDFDRYQLSNPVWYANILADECREMRNATFADIQAMPPPAIFAELFNADVALFHASRLPWQIAIRATRTTNHHHRN